MIKASDKPHSILKQERKKEREREEKEEGEEDRKEGGERVWYRLDWKPKVNEWVIIKKGAIE